MAHISLPTLDEPCQTELVSDVVPAVVGNPVVDWEVTNEGGGMGDPVSERNLEVSCLQRRRRRAITHRWLPRLWKRGSELEHTHSAALVPSARVLALLVLAALAFCSAVVESTVSGDQIDQEVLGLNTTVQPITTAVDDDQSSSHSGANSSNVLWTTVLPATTAADDGIARPTTQVGSGDNSTLRLESNTTPRVGGGGGDSSGDGGDASSATATNESGSGYPQDDGCISYAPNGYTCLGGEWFTLPRSDVWKRALHTLHQKTIPISTLFFGGLPLL
jgi:hypothetical protein